MSTFSDILTGEEEDLVKIFYNFRVDGDSDNNQDHLAKAAKKLIKHRLTFF